tara:strand:+ start:2073 stop:2408 length:336 start_codon:yes stop_codon:yes gene_type:complete
MNIIFILLILFLLSNMINAQTCSCNDTKDELGRNTWFLLHQMVKEEKTMERHIAFPLFMHTLSILYPCGRCTPHIKTYLEHNPAVLSEKWMCEFHNEVNKRLDKPELPCII